MKPISDIGQQELRWVRPKFMKREYELRASDEVLATVHWPRALSARAFAALAHGSWEFNREGFIKSRITVRSDEGTAEIATFTRRGWNGNGILAFSDGREIQWSNKGFWRKASTWSIEGQSLLHFSAKKQVGLDAPGYSPAELSLLATLGLYLLVLQEEEAAETSAATTVM